MKTSFLKTGITEINTVIDADGVILDQNIKTHSYLANTKEEFLLMYSSIIGIFTQMSQSEIRVYGYLLQFANGIKFDVSKKTRIDIAEATSLKERTVYLAVNSLVEKNLLHLDKMYQVNPRYAFRGSTSDRNNALKAIIEIGCREC